MWRTRLFVFILMILMNPLQEEEPTHPPKNNTYLHKKRRIGVSVCECGYVAHSTAERVAHASVCQVSKIN